MQGEEEMLEDAGSGSRAASLDLLKIRLFLTCIASEARTDHGAAPQAQ